MQGLALKNFKSYNKLNIFDFNPHVNVIIGGNGQGKSNFFKAFSFALSDRLQVNRTQFSHCIHQGTEVSNEENIQVEVLIKEKEGSDEQAKVCKIWKNNLTQEYYVNSKLINKKQFENFIESLGLSYTNPYNIVQQGKINHITLMDQFQLYKLLQEVTGARKFSKRKEEASLILKKIQIEKHQTKVVLDELDEKLKSFENKKEQFEFFAIEEKTKKYRMKKHLTQLLEATQHNLSKIKNQYSEISENLSKVILKKKRVEEEIQEGTMFIKTSKDKIALIQRNAAAPLETQILESQNFKDYQRKLKQLNKQLKQYSKQLKLKDENIEKFKKEFSWIEQKYEAVKINRELSKPNENKEKIISAFQAQIKSEEQNLKQIQAERQSIGGKIQQIEKFLRNKKNGENEKQYDRIQKQIAESKERIQLNKKEIVELSWHKNVLSIECDSLKEVLNQGQLKLKKSLPLLDFNLLDHCRQQKIKGVYGYFIEFVKIDENVSFAYEIAGMNKLCSLLVQNQQACMAVIDLNRRLKGRQINIIQLDYIRSHPAQPQSSPNSDNVKKLSNPKWIKVNTQISNDYCSKIFDDVEKLIKNTFAKYALVKDYETGLKVSKEYFLNCLTGDRQIIYAEGYHCKLGQQNVYHENQIENFYKFQDKRQLYKRKMLEKQEIQQKLLDAENEQINILNHHQKLQVEFNKLSNSVNEIKTERKMLEAYLSNKVQLDKKYHDRQMLIQKKKETIKTITSKNTSKNKESKFSKAQYDKIQEQYLRKRKEFNAMLKEVYEIEEVIQSLTTQKEEIDNKLQASKNNKASGVFDPKLMAIQAQKQIEEKEQSLKKLVNDIQEYSKMERELQGDKNHVQVKLITYRAEQEDLLNRLSEIGQIQEDVQELQQLSNSMSISNLQGRKKNIHFSAKDKLLFNKFSNILESFTAHKKTFADVEEAQQKIKRTIQIYEKDSEEYVTQMATKFEKQFINIFTFIVNKGSAQVRTKKVSEKIKEAVKFRNCLMVRVSFNSSEQALKKWIDFSGGEKTVIAISIILALQRCQPAPFYVLDEIDSALDPGYVQKIAQLLTYESQRNHCQYFISSFKEEMLAFPEEICSYYLVSCENRVSQVENISKNRAIDAIKSITMRK